MKTIIISLLFSFLLVHRMSGMLIEMLMVLILEGVGQTLELFRLIGVMGPEE